MALSRLNKVLHILQFFNFDNILKSMASENDLGYDG